MEVDQRQLSVLTGRFSRFATICTFVGCFYATLDGFPSLGLCAHFSTLKWMSTFLSPPLACQMFPASMRVNASLGNLRLGNLQLPANHPWRWFCNLRDTSSKSLVAVSGLVLAVCCIQCSADATSF